MTNVLEEYAVDAVVISLGGGADAEHVLTVVQVAIARAAKAAGVKLFVPSEFGIDTAGYALGSIFEAKSVALGTSYLLDMRDEVLKEYTAKIQEIGIPTTRVLNGWFTEIIPWVTSSAAKPGEFVITGKGDKKVSFTSVSDVGGMLSSCLILC